MTLTKAEIADKVWRKTDIPKMRSTELVDTVFEVIRKTLESGEDVLISSFGKFSVREKRQRRGRNPQTGEPMTIPPKKVVTFKCAGVLRNKINRKS
jgi:integration host factor subunit alpha